MAIQNKAQKELEQENKELMWSIYVNEDNTPGIEIIEL